MRRAALLAAVLAVAALGVACTSQATPTATQVPGIRMVAPEEAVILGDEVPIIVEVVNDDGPVDGVQVTFDVIAGSATYPDGFDTDVTDARGTATSLDLQVDTAGEVTVRVAAGSLSTSVELVVVE